MNATSQSSLQSSPRRNRYSSLHKREIDFSPLKDSFSSMLNRSGSTASLSSSMFLPFSEQFKDGRAKKS